MMRYAELHGNMQRYRIKSLYGNKVNLALMSDRFGRLSRITNSPAARISAAFSGPAFTVLSRDTQMKEMIGNSDKPHSTLGD